MPNNLALVVLPAEEEGTFVGASVLCLQEGPGTLKQLVGSSFPNEGKFHYLPIIRTNASLVDPDPYSISIPINPDNVDLTALILVEGAQRDGEPYYFAGQKLNCLGLVMWYSHKLQLFVPFHCTSCGRGVVQHLANSQEGWGNALRGEVSKGTRTLH